MAIQIQYRRDTATNWTTNNPVLYDGEIGYESDTGRLKVGDGITPWSTLLYWLPWQRGLYMDVYTTGSGSWTVPDMLKVTGRKWRVTLVGGGGGGGGCAATAGLIGNGGGSGAVVIANIAYDGTNNTMSYSVGAAGVTTGNNTAGGAGGNTTVTYGSITYTAPGGTGGATAATAGGQGVGYLGSTSGGTIIGNYQGEAGDSGGASSTTFVVSGMGGHTPLGFGSRTDGGLAANGLVGTGYGSGGSGAKTGPTSTGRTGGNGASGLIVIEY